MSTQLTPLGRVIAAAQGDRNWSNRALERRADELGFEGLTKSTIGNLKTKAPQQISTTTLKNLAILIQAPERVVVEAAIRSTTLEYPERNSTGTVEAIENDVQISARDKRILLAAITAMKEACDGDGEATPHTDADGTPATGEDDRFGGLGNRARGGLDHTTSNDGGGDNVRHLRGPSPGASAAQDACDGASVDEIMKHPTYKSGDCKDNS